MFQRDTLERLKQWAAKPKRKPLVLRGARQVGKTTLADELGKTFDTYIKLNLENANHKILFDEYKSMELLLNGIYLTAGKPRVAGSTLIFIDEIQYSSQAIMLLRYFYEEYPEIHIISAGSLLETLMNVAVSFPVGRVEYLAVRPCSFCEFLTAMDKTELVKAVKSQSVPLGVHSAI